MAGAGGTVVVYTLEEEKVPYRVTSDIDSRHFTLGDFMFLTKRFNYRFFFLSLDPEFGTIKDEVFDDSAVVPSSGGLVQAWLVPLHQSQDSTRISPNVTDLSNNVISEDIGLSTTTYSSTRIISGCSSSPGQHQTTSSGSPPLGLDHPGSGPASEAILTSTPISWNCEPKRCHSAELSRQYQRYECPSQSLSDTYVEILARMRWYQSEQGEYENMCGGQEGGQEVMGKCQEEMHSHRGQEVMNGGQGQEVVDGGQKDVNIGQDVMDGGQRQEMDGYQRKVQRGHKVMDGGQGQEVVDGGQRKVETGHEVIDGDQGQEFMDGCQQNLQIGLEVMDGGHNVLDRGHGDEEHVYVGQRNLYKPADCLWSNPLYSADLGQNFEDVPFESMPHPWNGHSGICPKGVGELTQSTNDTLLTDTLNVEKLKSEGCEMADIPAANPDVLHAQYAESSSPCSLDHNNNIPQDANTTETRKIIRCKSASLNPSKYPPTDVRPQTFLGTPHGPRLKADELYPRIVNGIDSEVQLKKARKSRKFHNSRKYSVQRSKEMYSMILPQRIAYREIPDAKIHGNDGQMFPAESPGGTLETNGNLASRDITESPFLSTTDLFAVSPLYVRKSVGGDAKARPRPTGIYIPESTSMMVQFSSFDQSRSSRGHTGDLLQDVEVKDCVRERGRKLERRTRTKNTQDSSKPGIDVQQEVLITPETNPTDALDEDLKSTVDAMLNPSSGVEVKERKWLKYSIPNALFGMELIRWLRRREGISSYMLAKQLAQVLLDCGVLAPFLSSQTRFVDEWYYTVKVKDNIELVY